MTIAKMAISMTLLCAMTLSLHLLLGLAVCHILEDLEEECDDTDVDADGDTMSDRDNENDEISTENMISYYKIKVNFNEFKGKETKLECNPCFCNKNYALDT